MVNLKVYYGFVKLGVRKKQALSVIFENTPASDRSIRILNGLQYTFYTRYQTKEEADDASIQNRVLTEYSIMFEHKSIRNSLNKALESNYNADSNNISKKQLEEIRKSLKEGFIKLYPDYKEPNSQLNLF